MVRIRLTLPGPVPTQVAYGYDATGIGYFVSVTQGRRRLVDWDGLVGGENSIAALLRVLIDAGVFHQESVDAAAGAILDGESEHVDDPQVANIVAMIAHLKEAASR